MSEASTLLELQNIDLSLLRLHKQLDELPEKDRLIEVRKVRNQAYRKRAQIIDMNDDVEQSVERFQVEDAALLDHLRESQDLLDHSSDYRETSAITRDMEGYAKRREKVEYELGQLSKRAEKIDDALSRINAAIIRLDEQERALTAQLKATAGEMARQVSALESARLGCVNQLNPGLIDRYEKFRTAKGGIAVGKLEGNLCSVCRVEYQTGQLQSVYAQAPLAICPICGRLLVVEDRER